MVDRDEEDERRREGERPKNNKEIDCKLIEKVDSRETRKWVESIREPNLAVLAHPIPSPMWVDVSIWFQAYGQSPQLDEYTRDVPCILL